MNTVIFAAAVANGGIWQVLQPFGITAVDPLLLSIVAGLVWPTIQAAFDKPYWTRERRVWLALGAAAVLSIIVWAAGHYPATWQLIVTQAGVIFAALTVAFRILKALGFIDWVGRVTPGGEPRYQPQHSVEVE